MKKAKKKKAALKAKAKSPVKKVKRRRKRKDSGLLINIKVKPAVRAKIMAAARRHAQGNLSLWLRTAGMNYTPKRAAA